MVGPAILYADCMQCGNRIKMLYLVNETIYFETVSVRGVTHKRFTRHRLKMFDKATPGCLVSTHLVPRNAHMRQADYAHGSVTTTSRDAVLALQKPGDC